MTAPDDVALVRRLQDGDASAVVQLVSAYRSRIEHHAFACLKNREDAEDVAQEVLFKVNDRIGTFRGDAALSSWVYRMTFNAAMSQLRRARATPSSGGLQPPADGTPRHPETADRALLPDEICWGHELGRRIRDVLSSLPAIYRLPIQLRDLRGLSTAQASEVLGISTQTLKSRLHRGRALVRAALADVHASCAGASAPPASAAVDGGPSAQATR